VGDLSRVKPIGNIVLFQFVEDMNHTTFKSTSEGGIVMVETQANKLDKPRWGKVLAVGPRVEADLIPVDEFILVEALGWTNAMTMEDSVAAEKFWFTTDEKIICVSDTLPDGLANC
jgi:co-chaperonin GroES (HSP10)